MLVLLRAAGSLFIALVGEKLIAANLLALHTYRMYLFWYYCLRLSIIKFAPSVSTLRAACNNSGSPPFVPELGMLCFPVDRSMFVAPNDAIQSEYSVV